ncbi:putative N-acetylmuramoyl-L-alanine amidase, partial [Trichinella spiralis]|uniref:putative N-acetylmuramoyl-L-alanine amidase n=1 Tax=Trichinella spiralis TaxID=6334 RepID=UPI0001EFDC7A
MLRGSARRQGCSSPGSVSSRSVLLAVGSLPRGSRVTSVRLASSCLHFADGCLLAKRRPCTLVCHTPAAFPLIVECLGSAASSVVDANSDCPGGLCPTCDNRVVLPEPSKLRRRACSGSAGHPGPCSQGFPVIHFFKPRNPASCRL